uniref:Uncharacterized protein n=1 Tax=Brassica oleracea var. oleracea TaxID=109376 RepID=A0A0D3CAY7_BRAOL
MLALKLFLYLQESLAFVDAENKRITKIIQCLIPAFCKLTMVAEDRHLCATSGHFTFKTFFNTNPRHIL